MSSIGDLKLKVSLSHFCIMVLAHLKIGPSKVCSLLTAITGINPYQIATKVEYRPMFRRKVNLPHILYPSRFHPALLYSFGTSIYNCSPLLKVSATSLAFPDNNSSLQLMSFEPISTKFLTLFIVTSMWKYSSWSSWKKKNLPFFHKLLPQSTDANIIMANSQSCLGHLLS